MAAPPLGADALLRIDRPDGRSIRYLIQAKRLYDSGGKLKSPTKSELFREKTGAKPSQYRLLTAAARNYKANPYYMFCPETPDAHSFYKARCRNHRNPQDCASILVPAQRVRDFYKGGRTLEIEDLLASGRPLVYLLGSCGRRERLDVFERARKFAEEDNGVVATHDDHWPASSAEFANAVTIDTGYWRPVRREPQMTATGTGNDPAVVIRLGKRDLDKHGRSGWNQQASTEQTREAARRYWRMNPSRAAGVRFLVAWAEGEPRGFYRVVESRANWDRKTNGYYLEFGVSDIDDDVAIRALTMRARTYVDALKPGARNPVGYI